MKTKIIIRKAKREIRKALAKENLPSFVGLMVWRGKKVFDSEDV